MKTVIAAIDFSPVSRRVLAKAVELSRAIRARLVVVHAVRPPAIVTDLAPLVGEAVQFTAKIEYAARRNLQRWKRRLAKCGTTVETICRQGFPMPVVLAQAQELDASYLVLGSHGHTALYNLVVGSTTREVLKRASCPVVIVPARGKRKIPALPSRSPGRKKRNRAVKA